MTFEWIRFFFVAVILIAGLAFFVCAVFGVNRFDYVMNRFHSSGIGDTMGLFSVIAALVIATGFKLDSVKLILLVFFLWQTSPVSTHFLGQLEYFRTWNPGEHMDISDETIRHIEEMGKVEQDGTD